MDALPERTIRKAPVMRTEYISVDQLPKTYQIQLPRAIKAGIKFFNAETVKDEDALLEFSLDEADNRIGYAGPDSSPGFHWRVTSWRHHLETALREWHDKEREAA